MNRRINKILLDIMHNKKNDLQFYAAFFKVSEQSIRNDLKTINSELQKKYNTQIIIDDTGILLLSKSVDLTELLNSSHSFQKYNLSPNERKTILALLLTIKSSYVTTYYLSEYLMVSRNTLLNDIEELRFWFKKNHLELKSKVGKGYFVEGDEVRIRSVIMKLVFYNALFESNYDYALGFINSIFEELLLDIIDHENRYQDISKILLDVEKTNDIQLSDFAYQEVLCYLLIMIDRCKQGFHVKDIENIQEVKNSSKHGFAQDIIKALSQASYMVLDNEEILHLTAILRSKSYIKNNAKQVDSIEIRILITELIYNLLKEIDVKYYINFDLIELLENHLKILFYRIKQKNNIKNRLFDEIYHSYGDMFPLVKKHLKNIEEYLSTEITMHEISFIVTYVMAIVENNSFKPMKDSIKVRIVCNSGAGTAQLITTKLKSAFPQLEILSVDSSHALKKQDISDIDFIISTVAIKYCEIPVIIVNPILSDSDYFMIQKEIQNVITNESIVHNAPEFENKEFYDEMGSILKKYVNADEYESVLDEIKDLYRKKNAHNMQINSEVTRLSEILCEERIQLDLSVENWQDAITAAGQLLLKDGLITESYIESMIITMEENNAYAVIFPGIAVPHAEYQYGAITVGASFVRLASPIKFNHKEHDPVNYVIALCIPKGIGLGACLYYLTEMFTTETFVKKMDACKTEKEVMLKLINMEENLMR